MGAPKLDYETPRSLAAGQEASFVWEEGPNGLCVRFPAPPSETGSLGCAVVLLVLASVLIVLPALSVVWGLVQDPSDARLWVAVAVGLPVGGGLLCYLAAGVRKARIPPQPAPPSVLTISGGVLKIERTGRDGAVNVSWELSEIAGIRLCPTPDQYILPGLFSLLYQVLVVFPPAGRLIRISVMHPSGQVDDVVFQSQGSDWIEAAEKELRARLGLPPKAPPPAA